jgi:adenosylhomocysteine nucleosidase
VDVLVTFALEREFAPWRTLREFHLASSGTAPRQPRVFVGKVGGTTVRAAVTGMGQPAAARAMSVLLARRPDVCISSGLAGGLRPQYQPGDVLLARAVRELGGERQQAADSALLAASRFLSCRVAELFLTSPRLIPAAWEKRRLGRLADVVEMESLTVLSAARERGVPAVAIRAIADTCDEDLPYDFACFMDEHGQPKRSRALAEIVRRPLRVPALLRLNRRSQRAAELLCRFLDEYVQVLPQLMTKEEDTLEGVAAT